MNETMRKRLMDGVIELIQLDRNEDKMEHRELIAKSIHVMLALDFYRDLFEPKFLQITKIFFREYAATHFAQLNLSSYMLFVDNCMQKEAQRLSECLDISTKDALIKILENELIGTYLDRMLENPPELDEDALIAQAEEESKGDASIEAPGDQYKTEFDTFMLEKRIEDLQRMAAQVNRIGEEATKQMTERWGRHVYD